MVKRLSVKQLSQEEVILLGRASKGRDYKMKNRAQMVLLSKDGLSAARIASRLGVHRHTVEERIRRFNELGIEGLKDLLLPGRPPRITEGEKEAIFKVALSRPQELSLSFNTWSSSKLRSYLVEKGLVKEISPDWVRKLLQKRGSGSPRPRSGS